VAALNAAIAAFYYARVLRTMIIDPELEQRPPLRLSFADSFWVLAFALANVLPLLWWSSIDGWARASLTLFAGR